MMNRTLTTKKILRDLSWKFSEELRDVDIKRISKASKEGANEKAKSMYPKVFG